LAKTYSPLYGRHGSQSCDEVGEELLWSSPSPGYAIRLAVAAGFSAYPGLVAAVASAGVEIATLDVIDSAHKNVVVAITCNTSGNEHGSEVAERVITAGDTGRVVHSAHLIRS
jgi:hypothetical protein